MSLGGILKTVLGAAYDGLATRNYGRAGADTDPPKVVSGDVSHGDVSITKLEVFGGETGMPLISYVTEIHIFESIVSPVIYCEMFFKDGINLQNDLKMNEGSVIRLEFITPGASQSNECFFRINKIMDKTHNPNLTIQTFRVQMVSIEGLAAMNVPPDWLEGFSLRDTPGNIIKKIIKETIEILPAVTDVVGERRNHRLDIDSGHGIVSRSTQLQRGSFERNRKSFEAIHQVVLLAAASPEGDSLYTFFERKDGYYFKPIEKLIREKKKLLEQGLSDAIFHFDHLRNQDNSAVKFRNILAYNILSAGADTAAASSSTTSATNINPQTGENSTPATPAPNSIVSELTSPQVLQQLDRITSSDTITSTEYTHLNETQVERRRTLARLLAAEAQIMIYGDSNLSVGDVIECTFPTIPDMGDTTTKPSTDTGYYLITHLRHIILNTERPQHVISCNLYRAPGRIKNNA